MIALERARNKLAAIWFLGSAPPFLLLAIFSMAGKYKNDQAGSSDLQGVWSWFVPTIVPTLALIIGILGATAFGGSDKRKVKGEFFKLTMGLSVFYLLLLTLTILFEPMSAYQGLELYTLSNFWLTPVQGLVVAAVGYLFAAQEANAGVANAGAINESKRHAEVPDE